jgi:hypothetical protein
VGNRAVPVEPRELQPFGASGCDFPEEDAMQLLQFGRGVAEDEQNRLRLVGLEGERDDAALVRVPELPCKRLVTQEVSELEHGRRRERDTHQQHDLRRYRRDQRGVSRR